MFRAAAVYDIPEEAPVTGYWTRWPSREGLEREAESGPRRVLTVLGRIVLVVSVTWGTFADGRFAGWAAAAAAGGLVAMVGLSAAYLRTSREQRLVPSLALAAALTGLAWLANWGGAYVLADVTWLGLAVMALVRLPPAPAVLVAVAAMGSYTAVSWASCSAS